MRVARSLTSLSSAERPCHYPEGWSKTTAVENDSRRKRQPRSLTAFRVSGVSSPGAHPMKTLAAQAPTLPALQTLLGDDAQGLTQGAFDLLPVGVSVCDSEGRSEERRVGTERVRTCRARGCPLL